MPEGHCDSGKKHQYDAELHQGFHHRLQVLAMNLTVLQLLAEMWGIPARNSTAAPRSSVRSTVWPRRRSACASRCQRRRAIREQIIAQPVVAALNRGPRIRHSAGEHPCAGAHRSNLRINPAPARCTGSNPSPPVVSTQVVWPRTSSVGWWQPSSHLQGRRTICGVCDPRCTQQAV